jgi:hypothetical protein
MTKWWEVELPNTVVVRKECHFRVAMTANDVARVQAGVT